MAERFRSHEVAGLGSGRKHPQPDVLAGDGDLTVGIECKSSSGDVIYIGKDEAEKLEEFCDAFGCEPLIGVRFDREDWLFVPPGECRETEKKPQGRQRHGRIRARRGRRFQKTGDDTRVEGLTLTKSGRDGK